MHTVLLEKKMILKEINEDVIILFDDERDYRLPKTLLPDNAKVGSSLTYQIRVDYNRLRYHHLELSQ